MRWIGLTVCFVLGWWLVSQAADITLNWDPVPSPDLTGYRVYYSDFSPDGPFNGMGANEGDSPVTVDEFTTSLTLTGMNDNLPYYFTVTAFTAEGAESAYSKVVCNYWMPELIYPAEGAANVPRDVDLQWSRPETDADKYTFTLYLGTSPSDLATAAPLTRGSPFLAGPAWPLTAFAAGGLILLVLFAAAGGIRKRSLPWRLAIAGCLLTLAASCGGGGSDDSGGSTPPSTDNLLAPNTTYFWKIVADDGAIVTESVTGTFTTGS